MGCRVSFVITSRDEPEVLVASTVDGLLATSERYTREILLVDDGSLVPIQLARPDLHVVRNRVPIGAAQSRRLGGMLANGDVVVWMDAHMSFAPDWLDMMMAHAESGALLCSPWWNYELTQPLCWGADIVWCGERNYAKGRSPGFALRHLTAMPAQDVVDVPMVIGGCYMMLRESYEEIGGFSPLLRVWGSVDMDLSVRSWMAGKGVKCVTHAKVGHLIKPKFQYQVRWEHVEFNKVAMIRTVFDEPTALKLEQMMQPLPAQVQTWLTQVDFGVWRSVVQSHRQISDQEFFHRFVSNVPERRMSSSEVFEMDGLDPNP
jgi:hypothetical protein